MRPKKIILLVDATEQSSSLYQFILKTHAYRVWAARTAQESAALYPAGGDLLIAVSPSSPEAIRLAHIRGIPSMILADRPELVKIQDMLADAIVIKTVPVSELLERIKVMCARKRGPRRGTPRPGTARKRAAAVYAAVAAGIEG